MFTSIPLAEHESMMSNGDGICYVLFSRQNIKEPTKRYEQVDVLPLASSDDDENTFVHPPARPIPTSFYSADREKAWKLDETTKVWSRGNVTWGPPTFVLRVFSFSAQYKRQIYFGKNWKEFDKMVLKFNLNDEETVRKYNTWLDFVFKEHHAGYGIIRKEGLVSWVTLFDWDQEVFGFNLFLRKGGCDGPGRTEVDILKTFGQDKVIFRCFNAALDVHSRVVCGQELSRDELYPKNFIPLHEGLKDVPIITTTEDGISADITSCARMEKEENMNDLNIA
jgi:hypothetical protein